MRDRTGEQNQKLIEQLARKIERWRLVEAAIPILEVAKPFSFIASQGLLLCEPLLSFFYDQPRVADYAELLADRSNMERLISRLSQERPGAGNGGKEEA